MSREMPHFLRRIRSIYIPVEIEGVLNELFREQEKEKRTWLPYRTYGKSPVWNILIVRILQDSVPSLLPLHIDGMEKIQDFPGWGKLLTEK